MEDRSPGQCQTLGVGGLAPGQERRLTGEEAEKAPSWGGGGELAPHLLEVTGQLGAFSEASGEQSTQQTRPQERGDACRPLHGAEDTGRGAWGWEVGRGRQQEGPAFRRVGKGQRAPGGLDLALVGEDTHTSQGRRAVCGGSRLGEGATMVGPPPQVMAGSEGLCVAREGQAAAGPPSGPQKEPP